MLAGHLDVLVNQLRLVCDELSPENVDEGLGEEFEPVALVTVIEHQEILFKLHLLFFLNFFTLIFLSFFFSNKRF